MSTVVFHRIRCSCLCAETIITADRGDAIGSQTIQKSARPWQRSRHPLGLCATYLSDVAKRIRVVDDGTPFPLEIAPGRHSDLPILCRSALGGVRLVSSRQPGTPIPFSWALRRAAWSLYCDALVAITSEGPKACRFVAAEEWIRTFGSATHHAAQDRPF
jgi:hypothetical protein